MGRRKTFEFNRVAKGTFHPPLEGRLSTASAERICDGCSGAIAKGEQYLNAYDNLDSPSGGSCPGGYYCIACFDFD